MKNVFRFSLVLCLIFIGECIYGQNNIIPNTLDCSSIRPPFAFDIQTKWTSTENISNFCTPLCGDIDGDGKTEVIATSFDGSTIYIYDGQTGTVDGSLVLGKFAAYESNPYALCDVDEDGKAELFLVKTLGGHASATLYEITSLPEQRPITLSPRWTTALADSIATYANHSAIPAVADLDGDGSPEFVVAHNILESDGTLSTTSMNFGGGILGPSDVESVSYIVDLDKDSIPEIVVGTDVYKYNGITHTATLWKRCPSYVNGCDGTNMAADINLDGNVDLVFTDTRNHGVGTMVVWTPLTGQVLGTISNLYAGYRCYPVVGDIDGTVVNGKKYPEIVYNGQMHMVAYSYDGSSFSQKWDMATNEGSGVATFTFFDFNNDGVVELVYRDEQNLKIYNADGAVPTPVYSMPATSNTVIETPIVADVTGDGSANIIVTGSGKLWVFEGAASKWASCPNVWNQQMYSPLLIDRDLTVFKKVASPAWNKTDCESGYPRYYNGGPMQVPYISEESLCPFDLSPDVYIISGDITLVGTSAVINLVVGNQGLISAPANTPITFYKNAITATNIITSASTTLGTDLAPGHTMTITKTVTGLSPMPSQFYVRLLDDGITFPATGAYSDCNLSNNTKSFGTLELFKTTNAQNACIDGTVSFTVKLVNNTDQLGTPTTYTNIVHTDSLGTGWNFVSATPVDGTVGAYNASTHKLQWTVPTLAAGDSAKLIIKAQATSAGSIRNTVWVESVGGSAVERDIIEAYVIVRSEQAPDAATISPAVPMLCGGSVTLTANSSEPGITSYQWYKDGIEITGATSQTYNATALGSYEVTFFNGTCVSQTSDAVDIVECLEAVDDTTTCVKNMSDTIRVVDNDSYNCVSPVVTIITAPSHGTAVVSDTVIVYTPNADYVGEDNLTYKLACGANTSQANVLIKVIDVPDNIIESDCFGTPPATAWSIRETPLNDDILIHNYAPLLVGDIDADGTVEIIGGRPFAPSDYNYRTDGVRIFYYNKTTNKIALKKEFQFSSGTYMATFGSMAIARYNNTGYIVVGGIDKYIYAYNPTGGLLWKSDAVYNANLYGTNIGIADFNNDGVPEVYTGNQIYSLSTGKLLCDGGTTNSSGVLISATGHSTVAADMDGDGTLEIVAGVNIYKVSITNNNGTAGNSISLMPGLQMTAALPASAAKDGATQVVDIDNDGKLEVVVLSIVGGRVVAYVWKPVAGNQSYIMGSYLVPATGVSYYSIPMLGNIDSDDNPEIVFITNGSSSNYKMYALDFNPAAAAGSQISLKWNLTHTDGSGCTGATLFDFNQDGQNEIVYRDETQLRIIDGSTNPCTVKTTFSNVRSGTLREFPVIADVDDDGQAEIIVTGWNNLANTIAGISAGVQNGYLRMFKTNASPWAPARKVWNQYAYNAVNINEDLTVPKVQLNPATAFSGGTCGTVRPYNGYMMQQTVLNKFGCPLFLLPDASASNPTTASYSGTSLIMNVDVTNTGDAAIGPPVYIAIYKNSISTANLLGVGSLNTPILAGATATISDTIANISSKYPIANLIVRVNDNGTTYPYQTECNYSNEITVPYVGANNRKDARLNMEVTIQNGTLGNPVAVLFSDTIKYEITAVNASLSSGQVVIKDTLPLYADYVSGSAVPAPDGGGATSTLTSPTQEVLTWTFPSVSSMGTQTVAYKTTPEPGGCAAQPLFVNKAWVQFDMQQLPTNSTYHQGAGVAIVTFSALAHGEIYNDETQAVDFNTAARSGVLVVPDEGYAFVGWSHEEYISLKGDVVPAQSGIMEYDTLTVYGNVELQANFVRKDEVANENVSDAVIDAQDRASQNKVWSSGQNLYVQVKESGCVIRIYNTEGTLIRQLATVSDGTTTIDNLPRGIYIVTVNGQAGNKVRIE